MLFSKLLSFSVAISVVCAQWDPTPVQRDTDFDIFERDLLTFNPTPAHIQNARQNHHARESEPMTNAKRMALGLPPMPPTRRSEGRGRGTQGRGGRVGDWPGSGFSFPRPSSRPSLDCNKKGILKGFDAARNVFLGYVSTSFNDFGESFFTDDPSKALSVEIDTEAEYANIKALNFDDSKWELLGGIAGFSNKNSNIGPGSYHYGYFGGVNTSPKNSRPTDAGNSFTDTTGISERSESVIWSYHQDGSVTAQWINSDYSKPQTVMAYTQGTFCFTGDFNVFQDAFGAAIFVNLKFQEV